MKILIINTADIKAQIAINNENEIFIAELDSSMKHSENLLPEIEKLLIKSKLSLSNLDAIAVNVGPGSFTGLRISIATVKALLNVFPNIKCIKLTSFEILAEKFFENSNALQATFVLDALSGLFFCQEINKNFHKNEEKLITKEELIEFKNIVTNKIIDGASVEVLECGAETLIKLATKKFNNKEFISEKELLPLYIRPSQAEANRK